MPRSYETALPFAVSQVVVCPACGAHVHPPCYSCGTAARLAARRAAGLEGPAANTISPQRQAGDPTPGEIRKAAAAIRRRWPADEVEKRRVGGSGRVPWLTPFCQVVVDD